LPLVVCAEALGIEAKSRIALTEAQKSTSEERTTMLILGIQGGHRFPDEDDPKNFSFHDSAAVILRDGEILAGIEEERLSRIKHSNCFPVNAIRYCLESCNSALNDVDIIATNNAEMYANLETQLALLENPSSPIIPNTKSHFIAPFQQAFGIDVRDKMYFCNHHFAHAWSAFALSGFDHSLVLSIDGDGDNCSGMLLLGEGGRLRKLQEFKTPQSLGRLYQNLIKIVGYGRFDEYKVMGLAPYGDPRVFRDLFQKCYSLLPNGNYSVESAVTWFTCFEKAGLLSQARRKGGPFLQVHKDFAAALQEMVERVVLHVLQYFKEKTREKNLCMAGGVAHNCTMNGKVLKSGLFEKMFVQPAAHDAGGALGAAIGAWRENGANARPRALTHVYWGTHIGPDQTIARTLDRWSAFLAYSLKESIAAETARLLADGAVVGWIQGRSEFGPRALGNRSIIADPRPSENKLRINEMIKKREQYRPFAPSVLEERISDFFDVTSTQTDFSFMIFVLQVHERARGLLGAITHVDGTARVQSVSRHTNPEYWNLIKEFEKLTGVPILLNTSFNNNAEPIVDSIDDAVKCFLTTGINYLAVGNYLVMKKNPADIQDAALTLIPQMPPSRKLVKRASIDWNSQVNQEYCAIESTKSRHFGIPEFRISLDMFDVLQRANCRDEFKTLAEKAGVRGDRVNELAGELMELWSQRVINVIPRSNDGA
jgi:carbamoyltransferase